MFAPVWKKSVLAGCMGPLLLLTGCGSTTSVSDPTTVTLLTHDSFVISEALVAQLKKDTGITLRITTSGDAGAMVAGAILAAGAPSADVMFGIDNTLLAKATNADVFAPYTSAEISTVLPELAKDTANGAVTPIDYGDVCINIDDVWFRKRNVAVPTSIDQLTQPAYKDLLVVQDPATSSPGLAFMLATQAKFGDQWLSYWKQLETNGVQISGSWTDAYESSFSASGGTRPLVVSYATSPPAEIVYAESPKPKKPSTSVLTDGCYRQIEFAGVLRGTQHEGAAQQVVDWLLSPVVQADLPLSMFVFPARANTPLPEVFTKFATKVPNPLQLPATVVDANLKTWLNQWDEVMGR
jgi:thiamine transport system substrate-binding protein